MITSIKEFRIILEAQRQATDIEIHVMDYLNELRDSGVTNMFGAVSYILNEFPELDKNEASRILSLWMKNFNEESNYNIVNESVNILAGLSDQDEIRPDRMKAPDSTYRHDFMLFNSRNPRGGGLYIQDHMHDMLVDKYGKEKGEKAFNGILDTKGGAFFAYGDKIAREKSFLINELGLASGDAFRNYFKYSYFALWKMWMDKIGKPYKIPTAAEIQARKDEAERLKKEEAEKIAQAKKDQTKADFDRALSTLQSTYSQYMNIQPDSKDTQRIIDLFNKRNVYNDVPKMVNSIKDKNKAIRRGNAVIKYLVDNNKFDRYDLSYAEQFFKKANQL